MREYVLSTGAELDLDEIWEYIAQDSIQAADRWVEKLFDAFDALARNPRMGHTREDLQHFRFWCIQNPCSKVAFSSRKSHLRCARNVNK
jgi:plasmid stabilization system protein ParE